MFTPRIEHVDRQVHVCPVLPPCPYRTMPQKKPAKGLSPEPSAPATSSRRGSSASPEKPPGPLSIPVSPEERDTIKINNVNPTDLKNACDDALKRVRTP